MNHIQQQLESERSTTIMSAFLDWYGLGPASKTQRGELLLAFGSTVEMQIIAIGQGSGLETPRDQSWPADDAASIQKLCHVK